MPKVIKVSFAEEGSVRITDYRYVKPRVELTVTVEEGENYEDVVDVVVSKVREMLDKYSKQAKKIYSEQYVKNN